MISITYEDEDLLILNKPTGMPSAPLHREDRNTAAQFALERIPEMENVRRPSRSTGGRGSVLEAGLVNRLDTGTSGLLVFAKNPAEMTRLLALWKQRRVQKIYRTIITASLPLPAASSLPFRIDTPLAHSARSSKRMVAQSSLAKYQHGVRSPQKSIRGKWYPAMTDLLKILPVSSSSTFDLEVQIHTGVMHQIRCHLASHGWPILGDPIYYGRQSHLVPNSTLGWSALNRVWLHAWRLTFPLKSGTNIILESSLPSGWPSSTHVEVLGR